MSANPSNSFIMDRPDERFNDSQYGVAATYFERETLKKEYAGRVTWIDDPNGLVVEIGKLGEVPLRYNFFWATINGFRILFYECAGEFDARPFVQRWLRSIGPEQLTTALMFHQVIMLVTEGQGLPS